MRIATKGSRTSCEQKMSFTSLPDSLPLFDGERVRSREPWMSHVPVVAPYRGGIYPREFFGSVLTTLDREPAADSTFSLRPER